MRTGVLVGCTVASLALLALGAVGEECGPEVRAPIVITSDYEFTAENGVVSGSGIASDPYVIEGGTIDAGYSDYGIRIERTTRYFVIRDLTVSGASKAAIFLSYVRNGVIQDCRLVGNWIGVTLNFSSDNRILRCALESNTDGVHLYFSRENRIEECTLSRNDTAIWLDASHENAVTGNSISDNHMGVYLDLGSEANTIYRNTFVDNIHNAHSVTANSWDCDGVGNYWFDYRGIDADENGIGDAPYVIRSQGDQDNFPLLALP